MTYATIMHTNFSAMRVAAAAACVLAVVTAAPAWAQTPTDPAAAPPPAPSQPADQPLSDARVDPLQPDFNLSALPVTLRLPAHKMSFRVTHRFLRSLGQGDVGDLLDNFFGFDSGAQIGLELRYGLRPGTQVGIHRTSDQSIELFGQQSLWREGPHPVAIDAIATFEGRHNLRGQHMGAFGALVSRKVAGKAAVYVEPIFVANTNSLPSDLVDHNSTFMLGLGTRVRVRPTTYVVAEVTPRLAGYDPGVAQASFGLEKRVGGHTFQVNFSDGFGTTLGQLALGGVSSHSWYIGFNISRKFF
jgi:Membrane bound beta barrel domain (DUF5777)